MTTDCNAWNFSTALISKNENYSKFHGSSGDPKVSLWPRSQRVSRELRKAPPPSSDTDTLDTRKLRLASDSGISVRGSSDSLGV